MRVELQLKSLAGACADGCFYGGTEFKTRDFARVGARICCRTDIPTLGILYSDTELAIVAVFSQYKRQSFSIQYRAVDPSEVPSEGRRDYPPPPEKPSSLIDEKAKGVRRGGKKTGVASGSSEESSSEEEGENGSSHETTGTGGGPPSTPKKEMPPPPPPCLDIAVNCYALLNLCDNDRYRDLMRQQCARTCMKCPGGSGGPSVGGPAIAQVCGLDHASCGVWAHNGFCDSVHYSAQVKREICPRTCRFCA